MLVAAPRKGSPDARHIDEHLEELTRRLVNKLLHDPISMIRKSEGLHGTSAQYLHALEQLFRLQEGGAFGDEEAE